MTKPFGVRGEIKIAPITDNIERFKGIAFVFVKQGSSFVKIEVEESRVAADSVLLKLLDVKSREAASRLIGEYLYIDRAHAVKADPSSHYYYDLCGCAVKTIGGELVGIIRDIQNAGSCDVYIVQVKNGGEELLLPALSDVIKKIDVERKEITVVLPEGLR